MGGGPVGLRVDGDAAQTEAARRAHHAPRNLTPVGDQHRLKHSDQSPRQAGLRFSRKAATPSRASAEARSSAMRARSEEHTSELQSLMRISYAVFCLKKQKKKTST